MTRNRPRRAQPRRDRPLRNPTTDPNVVERAVLYLNLADLLDPTPAPRLATVKTARRHRKEHDS